MSATIISMANRDADRRSVKSLSQLSSHFIHSTMRLLGNSLSSQLIWALKDNSFWLEVSLTLWSTRIEEAMKHQARERRSCRTQRKPGSFPALPKCNLICQAANFLLHFFGGSERVTVGRCLGEVWTAKGSKPQREKKYQCIRLLIRK